MDLFSSVFNRIPNSLQLVLFLGFLLAVALRWGPEVWANTVHGQGWWKTEKLRLEVEKLQVEIALLESEVTNKGLVISSADTPAQQRETMRAWAIDRQFVRQMLAAWLGAMTVLVFLMATDLLYKLAKGVSLGDLKVAHWLLSSLPYFFILSLPVPFAASNKRGGTFMEAMREGLSSAITIFIVAIVLLAGVSHDGADKKESETVPTPATQQGLP